MPSTIETEIVIDRPPEEVKSVFMDWKRYPEWNPFITELSLLKGDIDHPSSSPTKMKLSIKTDEKSSVNLTPTLLTNTVNEFRWKGVVFGGEWLLSGEHWFQFLPLENGTKTRFVQGETFYGILKFVFSVELLRKGFTSMNEALKKEVESK